jgi:hypothetical protein
MVFGSLSNIENHKNLHPRFEKAHRKYIDIQIVAKGTDYRTDCDYLTLTPGTFKKKATR